MLRLTGIKLLLLILLLNGCSKFALLSSGSSLAISNNTYAKVYSGMDFATTLTTEKDIKTHGATVHTVTSELDSGKILGQVTINILKKDTPKNLARKLIVKENKLYTKVIRN